MQHSFTTNGSNKCHAAQMLDGRQLLLGAAVWGAESAAAHLCLHEVLRRRVVQHACCVHAARQHTARHAQLAAQVHA